MEYRHNTVTLRAVVAVFERQQWRYEVHGAYLFSSFDGVPLVISVDEERQIILFQTPLAVSEGGSATIGGPTDEDAAAAIYMLSVNYRLAVGSFTRDHRDGEIRFELSIPVLGSAFTEMQLKFAILALVGAVSEHGPVIVALLVGRLPLRQALAQLDRDDHLPPAMSA